MSARRLALLVSLASCVHSHDARIAAFGASGRNDLEGAAIALRDCLYTGDADEQFLCQTLYADVRFRQRRWAEAASMYHSAFRIRDDIAKERGFGAPSVDSLASWAWAAAQIHDWNRAKAVVDRALSLEPSGEPPQLRALLHLIASDIAKARGDSATVARERNEAAVFACSVEDIDHFVVGETHRLGGGYFPVEAWMAIGAACPSPGGDAPFIERARAQARLEHLPPP